MNERRHCRRRMLESNWRQTVYYRAPGLCPCLCSCVLDPFGATFNVLSEASYDISSDNVAVSDSWFTEHYVPLEPHSPHAPKDPGYIFSSTDELLGKLMHHCRCRESVSLDWPDIYFKSDINPKQITYTNTAAVHLHWLLWVVNWFLHSAGANRWVALIVLARLVTVE